MSSLTEEQRRRIEENRRKALERRAIQSSVNQVSTEPSQRSFQPAKSEKPVPHSFQPAKSEKPVPHSFQSATSEKPVPHSFQSATSEKPVPHSFQPAKSEKPVPRVQIPNPLDASKRSPCFKDPIKAQCILLSRKRFYVDMCFHKETIDVFKTVPGRMYDLQTKKWNFPIEEHDTLITLMKPLQPRVLLIPLPRPLVQVFKKADEVKTIKEFDLSSMDPVLVRSLLPFQREGLFFGIQHGGKVLLADDMGLGKTIQGIAVASYFMRDWPLLVVTPSSVRYSWLEAFRTWLPSLEAQEISLVNSSKDHIPNDKVIIMSYDILAKMQGAIVARKFNSCIFDESHFLKNFKSARTRAAQAVMRHMKRIVMLSGTPALSRPVELFTQVSALCPQYFSSYQEYGLRYCNGKKMPWGWDFSGSSNMAELQLLLEEVVMIRRLKSDVIKQLPSKCRQVVVLDPSRISFKSRVLKAMSSKMQQKNLRGMERRGALLEYFHETGAVKIPAVCEYVLDLLESDRKFICFAHHQSVIDSICNCIEKKKIDFIRIDGSVSSEQRKKLCDKFQLNDSCKVAVLSITSANCGITLTAASLVVFAELFWNPGILTQAEDRAHRIGQEDSVVVQYLVARGTADDEIWPLVQKKLDILNKAGLSKDNFKTADTVISADPTQSHIEDFWNEFDLKDIPVEDSFLSNSPEKRLKLE